MLEASLLSGVRGSKNGGPDSRADVPAHVDDPESPSCETHDHARASSDVAMAICLPSG